MVRPDRARVTGDAATARRHAAAGAARRAAAGPLRDGAFTSTLRSQRLTTQLGAWLGIAFGICFITGLISHFIQHPGSLVLVAGRTGLALPRHAGRTRRDRAGDRPAARREALVGLSEAVRVAAGEDVCCTRSNAARSRSSSPAATVPDHDRHPEHRPLVHPDGLLLHHRPLLHGVARDRRAARAHRRAAADHPRATCSASRRARAPTPEPDTGGLSRRGLLTAVATSAGVITLATVGQTIAPLSPISVLGPRRPDQGPQGFPVNKSAQAAGVITVATDPAYRLTLIGPAGTHQFSLADLAAMEQHTVDAADRVRRGLERERRLDRRAHPRPGRRSPASPAART